MKPLIADMLGVRKSEVAGLVNDARKDILRLQKDNADVKGLAPALGEEIEDMARKNRLDLLELGAAGRLAMQLEVLPLDDEGLNSIAFVERHLAFRKSRTQQHVPQQIHHLLGVLGHDGQ